MGWRSKFFFLIVIYCAGFFSAIYFVANDSENSPANDKAARIVSAINHYSSKIYSKASEKYAQIDKEELKAACNKGFEAMNNMTAKYTQRAE
jgi:hypothetical protein